MTDPTSGPPPVPNRLSSMPEAVPNQFATPSHADPGWSPEPAEGSGLQVSRTRIAVIVGVGILLIGGFVFRDRLSGSAQDIRVGDCFMVPVFSPGLSLEPQLVDDVAHIPCKEPHDAEAFFVGRYDAAPDATFPPGSAFDAFWEAECVPAFEAYTGSAYEDVEHLGSAYFQPGAESWQGGDREVMCYLMPISGRTSQSYKDVRP